VQQLYIDILHNRPAPTSTSYAPGASAQYQIQVTTTLIVELSIKYVDSEGRWHDVLVVSSQYSSNVLPANDNDRFVITDNFSDAWVGAFQVPVGGFANNSFVIDDSLLVTPNDLGPVPQPTATTLIPQDSYPILVGCSRVNLPNNTSVSMIRYQYWHRGDDSYSLGVGEEQTITTSTTTGIISTSSTLETVAASLDMSVSAGWGPIATSINASLNTQTTTQQSVTVTETNTTYIAKKLSNLSGTSDIIVIHWQLIDTILITKIRPQNPSDVLATLAVAYAPGIVQTYKTPDPGALSSASA
jgi:hypothetical protein